MEPLVKVATSEILREILHTVRREGFRENRSKIHVSGPGARKLVLGLLVDGDHPRLSKQARTRMERHLYSVQKFGWVASSKHFEFETTIGYFNHVRGLMAYVKDVDPERYDEYLPQFESQPSPLIVE